MRINTQIDVLGLVDQTAKTQKNLVYSTVQGINRTAQMIQHAQQQALAKDFTLRTLQTKDFLTRRVAVIRPFASVNQGRLYAEVSMNPRAARPVLLPGFESGEQRQPARGKLIAAPVVGGPARPSFNNPVKDQFMFKNLRLRAKKTAGGRVFRGQEGTYQGLVCSGASEAATASSCTRSSSSRSCRRSSAGSSVPRPSPTSGSARTSRKLSCALCRSASPPDGSPRGAWREAARGLTRVGIDSLLPPHQKERLR